MVTHVGSINASVMVPNGLRKGSGQGLFSGNSPCPELIDYVLGYRVWVAAPNKLDSREH